jgi:hypothetical protein
MTGIITVKVPPQTPERLRTKEGFCALFAAPGSPYREMQRQTEIEILKVARHNKFEHNKLQALRAEEVRGTESHHFRDFQ